MEQTTFLKPNTGAVFSPCRLYRYSLWRTWDESKPYTMFIGLNPSTADEIQNDPTVTRCINYARDWGYGAMMMTNIFAYRATDPRVMKAQPDPVGPDNDRYLAELAEKAGIVVAAWGNNGAYRNRSAEVRMLIPALQCLKMTAAGEPQHPLYLAKSLKPALIGGAVAPPIMITQSILVFKSQMSTAVRRQTLYSHQSLI